MKRGNILDCAYFDKTDHKTKSVSSASVAEIIATDPRDMTMRANPYAWKAVRLSLALIKASPLSAGRNDYRCL
jgi:hypothetical protein